MAYATLSHVVSLNQARATFNADTKPTGDQVVQFIDEITAEVDTCLRRAGYSLPVATTATSALKLLQGIVVAGANWKVELAAPMSDKDVRDEYQEMYKHGKKMIEMGELDAEMDTETALPRSNFDTDSFLPASRFFYDDQEF
jgi:hypothetical protein